MSFDENSSTGVAPIARNGTRWEADLGVPADTESRCLGCRYGISVPPQACSNRAARYCCDSWRLLATSATTANIWALSSWLDENRQAENRNRVIFTTHGFGKRDGNVP